MIPLSSSLTSFVLLSFLIICLACGGERREEGGGREGGRGRKGGRKGRRRERGRRRVVSKVRHMYMYVFYNAQCTCRVPPHLKPLDHCSQRHVDWYQHNHHSEPGKYRWTHGLVEEDESKDDLKWCGPQHVAVRSKVHYLLSIHRHQVHYLPYCACATSLVAEPQGLRGKSK